MTSTQSKIRSREGAIRWRQTAPRPIVFTNGVFDLLHPGHVELLERARREGAALIVGVNGDGSAQRLGKGPGRPIMPAAARVRVVAALSAVDCVVCFTEDTPEALIHALQPDVLVKGADYSLEEIPGRDFVEASGGRVVRIPLDDNQSSTSIVERIRATT